MRKDSTIIGSVSVLIAAALIGGAYYMTEVREPALEPAKQPTTWQTLTPQSTQPIGNPGVSAETPAGRTNTPIKCHDPEVGEFWTNAATCEDADLYNRISIAEPVLISPERERYGNENYTTPREEAGRRLTKPGVSQQTGAEKPSLR